MRRIKTCVSLYSLQNQYMTKKMSLEDIFRFLHENQVDGVEFLPDQMMHGAPHPSDETPGFSLYWSCDRYRYFLSERAEGDGKLLQSAWQWSAQAIGFFLKFSPGPKKTLKYQG